MANHYDRKAELSAELNRARSRAAAFRREMEGSGRKAASTAKSSTAATVARYRYAWIMGAVVLGFVVAKLPARTKKIFVDQKGRPVKAASLETAGKAGMAMAILKLVVDVTKPVIMAWATKKLGEAVSVGKDVRRKVEKVDRKI